MLAGGGHSFASLLPTFLSRQFEHMILSYSATIRRKDFHFCRLYPGDDFATSLSRHEHYLCLKLKLKPGDNVLVIGCGTGDIVFELINYADVNVIGFDEDADKIQQALQRVQRSNLSNRSVSFVSGNLDDLANHFEPESFDCVYSIEGLRNMTSFKSAYYHVHTILKPGGRAGIIDWCFTSSFVPANTDHRRLSSILSHTTNVSPREPEDRTISSACSALRLAGLQLEEFEDLAQREGKIAWYEPLERALRDSRMSSSQSWTMWPLDGDNEDEKWHTTFGMSRDAAIVVLEAARRKLFTPMAMFIALKPRQQVI